MSDAFPCHPESKPSVLAPRDGLVATHHTDCLEPPPSKIEATTETPCGFRDLTPEEKQRVTQFYTQRGCKHRSCSTIPPKETP